jgi:hypothetical protein
MDKLLKSYNFIDLSEYFDMIIESVINGQIAQSKEQFNAMPKEFKKSFIINGELTERQRNAFVMLM